MKKFVVLYHAPKEAMGETSGMTPEQAEAGTRAWMQWAQKTGDKLVDLGAPLMYGQQISHDGSSKESKKDVAGYSIIEAENMDEAKKMMEGHPHTAWHPAATIEIHEVMPVPGM